MSPRRTLKDLVHVAKEAYAQASPNTLRVHTLSKVCESPPVRFRSLSGLLCL